MFLNRITGELDPWRVTEETHDMKRKHGPHQAGVVGKEGLCNQGGWDQSTGPSSQRETEAEGGQRGGGRPSPPLSLQDWQSRHPGKGGGWEGPGVSGAPPPSDEGN